MHYIRDDVLCAYVLSRLQYWSQQAQQNEEKLLKRLMGATDRERSAAKKKQAAELRKAEKRKAEIDALLAEHAAASSVKASSGNAEERTQYSQRWQVNW